MAEGGSPALGGSPAKDNSPAVTSSPSAGSKRSSDVEFKSLSKSTQEQMKGCVRMCEESYLEVTRHKEQLKEIEVAALQEEIKVLEAIVVEMQQQGGSNEDTIQILELLKCKREMCEAKMEALELKDKAIGPHLAQVIDLKLKHKPWESRLEKVNELEHKQKNIEAELAKFDALTLNYTKLEHELAKVVEEARLKEEHVSDMAIANLRIKAEKEEKEKEEGKHGNIHVTASCPIGKNITTEKPDVGPAATKDAPPAAMENKTGKDHGDESTQGRLLEVKAGEKEKLEESVDQHGAGKKEGTAL